MTQIAKTGSPWRLHSLSSFHPPLIGTITKRYLLVIQGIILEALFVKVKVFFVLFKEVFDKSSVIYYKYPIILGGVIIDQVQSVDYTRLKEDDQDKIIEKVGHFSYKLEAFLR